MRAHQMEKHLSHDCMVSQEEEEVAQGAGLFRKYQGLPSVSWASWKVHVCIGFPEICENNENRWEIPWLTLMGAFVNCD